jgi:hypothetical protein
MRCMVLRVRMVLCMRMVAMCMPVTSMRMRSMTADCCTRSYGHLLLLLLVLPLYVLPDSVQIVPILLPATRAGVVVLVLQPLVAEQAHLVPVAAAYTR